MLLGMSLRYKVLGSQSIKTPPRSNTIASVLAVGVVESALTQESIVLCVAGQKDDTRLVDGMSLVVDEVNTLVLSGCASGRR